MASNPMKVITSRRLDTPLIVLLYTAVAWIIHGREHDLWRDLLGGGDGYAAGLPSKLFSATFSAWNPFVQLGQYTFPNTQFQALYPPGLIPLLLFHNTFGYNVFILCHYVLAGAFFYLFARNLNLGRYAACFGGLCFMCSGFMMAHKGHQAMMSTAVWLPLVLYFIDRFVARGKLREIAYAAFPVAMSVLGGFPQVTVYGLAIVVLYLLYRLLQKRRREGSMSLGVALRTAAVGLASLAGLSFLLSSLQLLSVAEALPYMTRARISMAMFNADYLPFYHFAQFLVPNILGGFHGIATYSMNLNIVETYPYMGLVPIALVILALIRWRSRIPDVWFWTGVVILSSALSLGLGPIQRVLYHVPVYNLFRAPARHLYELDFGIAVLASLSLDALLRTLPVRRRQTRRALVLTCAIMCSGVIAILGAGEVVRIAALHLAQSPQGVPDVPLTPAWSLRAVSGLIITNLRPGSATVLLPLVGVVLTCLALIASFRIRSQWILGIAFPLLLVADVQAAFGNLYDNPDTRSLNASSPPQEVAFLRSSGFDNVDYRIYPIDPSLVTTYPLLNMMYALGTINDYTPMWLRDYQRVTGFELNGAALPDLVTSANLMSVLGVRYLLARELRTIAELDSVVAPPTGTHDFPEPPLNCAALRCALAGFGPGSLISLRSTDGVAVAIVHFPIALMPSAYYRIDFDVREQNETSQGLNVDLYGVRADGSIDADPAQHRWISVLPPVFRHDTVVLKADSQPVREAYIRFFTQSQRPIDIEHVRIAAAPAPPAPVYTKRFSGTNGISIYENSAALPRFRFVSELLPARDLNDAGQTLLYDPSFDPARQALVEGLREHTRVEPGRLLSEHISNSTMHWEVETGTKSFFVVGDSWFPGWTATIDGKKTEIRVVNGFMRGLMIDGAGRHSVGMSFWPSSVTYGIILTGIGVLATIWLGLKHR